MSVSAKLAPEDPSGSREGVRGLFYLVLLGN